MFFLHQSGARFRQGWALRQVEQAWGALQQSRLSLNLGPRFPADPRSKRIAEGNVRLKGTRWADAIYADALLQATLRSATNEGRRGVRAHYTPTVEGRRYDATGVDLTARATTALNAASGGGPVDWESDLPADSNRFLIAPDMGALESPVVGEFARAMEEVTRSDAYQAAYLWAQVGVSLPGEAGLMTASMIPLVGEGMDAHALATSESRMERWIAGTSLGLSGITLGAAPNFGRFARFVGDTADTLRALKTGAGARTAEAISGDAIRVAARAAPAAMDAGQQTVRLGRNAVMETAETAGRTAPVPELKKLKCFVAGTLVKAEAGLVPIEEIEIGDRVWSRDESTGDEGWREVVELFETRPEQLVHLDYQVSGEGDVSELIGTWEHPFWSMDREEWVPMGELKIGERLHVAEAGIEAKVTSLSVEQAPAGETFRTFNFEVEGWHTYFVAPKASPPGSARLWVHKLCDAGVDRLIRQIEYKGARFGERVLGAIRGRLNDDQLKLVEAAIDSRRAAPENAAGLSTQITGKGYGGHQLVDRVAGEIEGITRHADRILRTGGTDGTRWGAIYQHYAGSGHWFEPIARGNALQSIVNRRLLNNTYALEADVLLNQGSLLGRRSSKGALLRPDFQIPLSNGKLGVIDLTTPGQAPKISKYADPQTPFLLNVLYGR